LLNNNYEQISVIAKIVEVGFYIRSPGLIVTN